MAGERTYLRWRPGDAASDPQPDVPLAERFAPLAADRAASARALVLEACETLGAWLRARASTWGGAAARRELDGALAAFARAHGWRGTVARWMAAVHGALDLADAHASAGARELALEELGLWQGGEQGAAAASDWRGEALAPGQRLPDRAAGARAIAREIGRGEVFLVHGWSETVALALEALFDLGLAPEVVVSEGGADLGGRRLARRLATAGIAVELVYDLALFDRVGDADRVWIGTEAIGAGAFVARRGARALFEEARRLEVSSAVVATSDKLTPHGRLELPSWPLEERWILWEDAPPRVDLDAQTHERVPSALADGFLTEAGHETVAALALRASTALHEPRFRADRAAPAAERA